MTRKEMTLGSQIFMTGKDQKVHSLNLEPDQTKIIVDGDQRIVELPGRLRDALKAPEHVMVLLKAINADPGSWGARNIKKVYDGLKSFVHYDGPGGGIDHVVDYMETGSGFDSMFRLGYNMSTSADGIINVLGINLVGIEPRDGYNLTKNELERFVGENRTFHGFFEQVNYENVNMSVSKDVNLVMHYDVFNEGWHVSWETKNDNGNFTYKIFEQDNRLHYGVHSGFRKNNIKVLESEYQMWRSVDGHLSIISYVNDGNKIYLKNIGPEQVDMKLRKADDSVLRQMKNLD
ncbi:hypothetical protein HOC35_00270 [Candidatus Woesearchaeota archaeon]|nr:hypothetical protein [Candidatus Woesearchaeota archaeon]